jgi:hypothetical protein
LLLGLLAVPQRAEAVRFTLGLESALTPVVVDSVDVGAGNVRIGLRPVLDMEVSRAFAFGVYTPFVLVRAGANAGTGSESVFAAQLSLRLPYLSAEGPEETLWYATLRGGFGTADGRAGLYLGGALGGAFTWLESGRGLFAELHAGHIGIPAGGSDRPFPEVDRWLVGLSIGVVFRLGGEGWERPPKAE